MTYVFKFIAMYEDGNERNVVVRLNADDYEYTPMAEINDEAYDLAWDRATEIYPVYLEDLLFQDMVEET